MIPSHDLIHMAAKVGVREYGPNSRNWSFELSQLEQFAALVEARAAAAEREACAKVAEGFEANRDWVPGSLWGNIRSDVAAEIRARGAA